MSLKRLKNYKRHQFILKNMINFTTYSLIRRQGPGFVEVSYEMFSEHINSSNKLINLWAKEPISLIKMCLYNFKFDLALGILQYEIE